MKLDELSLAALLQARHGQSDNGGSSQDGASPLAWRREMEKAQADAWFHGALRHPQSSKGHTDPQAGKQPHRHVAMGSRGATGHRASIAVVQAKAFESFNAIDAPTLRHAAQPVAARSLPVAAAAAGAPVRVAAQVEPTAYPIEQTASSIKHTPSRAPDTLTALPAHEGRDGATRPSSASRLPVRVHIEGDAEHATVWLGIDAAARAELPAVTEAIGRWLAQAGYGVPTFVCNGRVIDETGREFQPAEQGATDRASATPVFTIEPATGESA